MTNCLDLSLAIPETVADGGRMVRILGDADNPQFVVSDLEAVLGIANMKRALARFDDDEKGVALSVTPGGTQHLVTVYEAGLYRLIFTARKESAKKFQRWVLHDVLPCIRKHGCYPAPPPACTRRPYLDRMDEAEALSPALPQNYWCVFVESARLLLTAEKVIVGSGLVMEQDDLLDGSIGRHWSKFRGGRPWATEPVRTFEYQFPPPSNRSKIVVRPKCYHLYELPWFREWLSKDYRTSIFPAYLQRKYGEDGFCKMLPAIRSHIGELCLTA